MTDLPAQISPAIHVQVRSVRQWVRLWYAADGLRHFLLWLLLWIGLDLALDWAVHLDRTQRAICAVLILAALGLVLYRRLLRPLMTAVADDALIIRVEQRHPRLRESLISAVQFARRKPVAARAEVSRDLVEATIAHGNRAAQGVNFRQVINAPALRRNVGLVLALLVAVAGVGVSVALADPMWIWFDRNVLLGDSRWPQQTDFVVEGVHDGQVTLPRGDDHQQIVDVEGIVPDNVRLDYAPRSGGTTTLQMTQRGERSFQATFKNMLEPFQFRVRGGDAVTDWIDVALVDRPAVVDFRLELTPPSYVGTQPEVVWAFQTQQFGEGAGGEGAEGAPAPRGTSAVYALKGSRLAITARANKPLSQVTFRSKERAIDATLDSEDVATFTAAVAPEQLVAGTYEIDLRDTSGPPALASRTPTRFTVRIRPDRPPNVQAKLLGISGMIVSRAVIPIELTLQDDFAVTQVRLTRDWRVQEEGQSRGDRGSDKLTAIPGHVGSDKFQHMHRFAIEPLNLPVGADLTFQVEADDNDTVSGPKTGKSPQFYVKIVREQDLRAELLRREQEQRQEFERLMRTHDELTAQIRGLAGETAGAAQLPDEQRKALADVQKRQHAVGTRCEAIARQFEAIETEVLNNRLEDAEGTVQRRLRSGIIAPLDGLATKLIPAVTTPLETARRPGVEKDGRTKALAAALGAQADVAAAMREILKHMVKWEGYQEAVNLALEVFKAQQDVNEATSRAIRKRLEGIFGGDTPAPKKP